jgi:hypothetical protein
MIASAIYDKTIWNLDVILLSLLDRRSDRRSLPIRCGYAASASRGLEVKQSLACQFRDYGVWVAEQPD